MEAAGFRFAHGLLSPFLFFSVFVGLFSRALFASARSASSMGSKSNEPSSDVSSPVSSLVSLAIAASISAMVGSSYSSASSAWNRSACGLKARRGS